MRMKGKCQHCRKKNVELVWQVRNRKKTNYSKIVCLVCGYKSLKVRDLYVEELPFVDKHHTEAIKSPL